MTTFDEINQKHQALLVRRESIQDPAELVDEAQRFLQEIEADSAKVVRTREREQVRGIIRYWAAFLFDQTHVYPQTSLQPPDPTLAQAEEAATRQGFLAFLRQRLTPVNLLLVILAILLLCVLGVWAGNSLILYNASAIIKRTPTVPTEIALEGTMVGTEAVGELPSTATRTQAATETSQPTPQATRTMEASATPGLSLTPDRPLPSATPTATATRPQATATQEPNLPGFSSLIPVLNLPATPPIHPQDYACTSFAIRISAALGEAVAGNEKLASAWDQAVLQVIPMGAAGAAVKIQPTPGAETVISLAITGAALENYYLLHVESSHFESLDILFLYSKGCQQAEMKVGYILGEKELVGSRGLTQVGGLSLGWRLVTWGPVPGADAQGWAALLQLDASGGNGDYVYWESQDGKSAPLAGDQVLITGAACQTGEKVVGVTSAGQAATRLVRILAPYCPGQIQELLPAP
jgi:hypothetical protein